MMYIWAILVIAINIVMYLLKRKFLCEKHKQDMLIERNKQVYEFRMRLLYSFPWNFELLPGYDDMLYSDRPLEAKYWIDVNKIVNLN